MYEVFIGGWKNSKSVIRKNRSKPDVAELDTPNILSDGEFRGFWIRWDGPMITVGHEGQVAAFLTFEDKETVPINYIGVCTGWGAVGSWIVEGKLTRLHVGCSPSFCPPDNCKAAYLALQLSETLPLYKMIHPNPNPNQQKKMSSNSAHPTSCPTPFTQLHGVRPTSTSKAHPTATLHCCRTKLKRRPSRS